MQQGDPLGPLLFALALRIVTRRIREQHPILGLNAWHLNDGTLVGDRPTLVAILDYLGSQEVRALGLQLNLHKCEVWWPSGDQRFPEFPSAVARADIPGVKILKVPVGSDAFVAKQLSTGFATLETSSVKYRF